MDINNKKKQKKSIGINKEGVQIEWERSRHRRDMEAAANEKDINPNKHPLQHQIIVSLPHGIESLKEKKKIIDCYFNKFVICYAIPTISTIDLLINRWFYSLYTLKWIAHFVSQFPTSDIVGLVGAVVAGRRNEEGRKREGWLFQNKWCNSCTITLCN